MHDEVDECGLSQDIDCTELLQGFKGFTSRNFCRDIRGLLQVFHVQLILRSCDHAVPRYIDELEQLLDENMLELFNTQAEDDSVQEVM